jgi:serine protease AprX
MRRLTLMLAVAVLAGLAPVVAGAGSGGAGPVKADSGRSGLGTAAGAAADSAVPARPAEPGGPAWVDGAVLDAARRAAAGGTLDLLVSLDRPAGSRLRSVLAGLGTWSNAFRHVPVAAVRLPVGNLEALRRLDGVRAVYLNSRLQYFLKESAELVNAAHAWKDLGVTGKGVTVAVLDTGVDFTHPDLAPAMKANVKLIGFGDLVPAVPLEGPPDSDVSSGHGTHVAGDVASRGTASGGAYKGLAPDAGLVGIGAGDVLSMYAVVEGFDWVMAHRERYGIKVVNNSWGTQFKPFDPEDPVNLATKVLSEAGVVVVFANGNDADEMAMNPYAQPPWVLPVAAGTKDRKVADFSSAGIEGDTVGLGFAQVDVPGETRKPLDMGLYHPAVTTTGENVVSTRANATVVPLTAAPGDVKHIPPQYLPYYTTLSGTSMASPETAGVVALLLQAAPELTPLQVRRILQVTARPIPDAPFHRQGYGYTDAGAAVDLARSLHGRPAGDIDATVAQRQAARDQAILDTLPHPLHTYAWTERGPFLAGSLVHKVKVPAGAGRVKVLTNGGTVALVGLSTYDITVTDAAGNVVGTSSNSSASGTTVLDLDLHKLAPDVAVAVERFDDLAYGEWTVKVDATGSLVPPIDYFLLDDAVAKRTVSTLVSVYGPQGPPCRSLTEFAPTATLAYRFQDDTATGVESPMKPGYTYVGTLPDGLLGQRTPARKLAGTFGQLTTSAGPPVFATAPLLQPLVLGGPAGVDTWVQGPSEVVTGQLIAELLDLPPSGDPVVIGKTPADVKLVAGSLEPLKTEAPISLTDPYTVPPGHQLGVRLDVTFVGTSGDTLYYDSDEYPSGVTLTTGELVTHPNCGLGGEVFPRPVDPPPPASPGPSPPADQPSIPGGVPVPGPLPAVLPPVPVPPALAPLMPSANVPASGVPVPPAPPVRWPTTELGRVLTG